MQVKHRLNYVKPLGLFCIFAHKFITNEIGLNITDIEKHSAKLGPPSVSVWNQRINLDGFVTLR